MTRCHVPRHDSCIVTPSSLGLIRDVDPVNSGFATITDNDKIVKTLYMHIMSDSSRAQYNYPSSPPSHAKTATPITFLHQDSSLSGLVSLASSLQL